MDELIAFLNARLDEDEAAAQSASLSRGGGLWRPGDVRLGPGMGDHITRHDPARALREVEAKRAILAEHAPTDWTAYGDRMCERCHQERHGAREDEDQCEWVTFSCRTVRALAAVYSDHPDYRPEWVSEARTLPARNGHDPAGTGQEDG